MKHATLVLCLAPALAAAAAGALEYPPTPRQEVVDDYHGTRVVDAYRWLEDTDSPQTADWVAAENQLSLPFLAALPAREAYHKRLTELWNYERYGVPVRKKNGALFFTRNDGLQNQAVLYVQDGADGAPRVLLDPNTLSSDGTIAMTQWEVAPDGRHVAYGLATAGSDWTEFHVLDVATGKPGPDVLQRIKFSATSWTQDGLGFFYSRYPDAAKDARGGVFDDLANQKLYYHRLGMQQSEDRLIYQRKDQPKWFLEPQVSDDGRYLFIRIRASSDNRNALYYQDLEAPLQPKLDASVVPLVERIDSEYSPIGNDGPVLYLLTTSKAPRKRIVAVDLRTKRWVTRVPQGADPVETALVAGHQFIVLTMHDAVHRLLRHALDGKAMAPLPMPGVGSVTDTPEAGLFIHGDADSDEFFYSYNDFSHPPQDQRCELAKGTCTPFQPVKLAFNPDDYTTEQVFYKSKDGTRVPLFISYRKGWNRKDGTRPALLYGYGGFDYAQLPSFARVELSVPALAWMEQGGLYAVANLRGGGEYGEGWHKAGTKEKKQNVFDDFIAAGQYLVAQGYTTTS